jgi:hypothetical protein
MESNGAPGLSRRTSCASTPWKFCPCGDASRFDAGERAERSPSASASPSASPSTTSSPSTTAWRARATGRERSTITTKSTESKRSARYAHGIDPSWRFSSQETSERERFHIRDVLGDL